MVCLRMRPGWRVGMALNVSIDQKVSEIRRGRNSLSMQASKLISLRILENA